MSNITIKEMENGDEKNISELVKIVFEEFIAPDFSTEGVNTFLTYISPDAILHRYKEGKHFLIIAKDNEQIVGIIEIRDYFHICLLFVNKNNHNKGIAKRLFEMAIKKCKEANADLKEFEVNSSRYAIPIYEKLGFKKTGEEQIKDGILFTPMKAII